MRIWLICCVAGLASCASVPESPWEGLTVDTEAAQASLDCGGFPRPDEVDGEAFVYRENGANRLEAYRVCAEANQAVVDEHAATIGHLKVARKALVEAGQSQYNIAAMRQQMLRDERRHHLFTSIGYWVLIVGLAL